MATIGFGSTTLGSVSGNTYRIDRSKMSSSQIRSIENSYRQAQSQAETNRQEAINAASEKRKEYNRLVAAKEERRYEREEAISSSLGVTAGINAQGQRVNLGITRVENPSITGAVSSTFDVRAQESRMAVDERKAAQTAREQAEKAAKEAERLRELERAKAYEEKYPSYTGPLVSDVWRQGKVNIPAQVKDSATAPDTAIRATPFGPIAGPGGKEFAAALMARQKVPYGGSMYSERTPASAQALGFARLTERNLDRQIREGKYISPPQPIKQEITQLQKTYGGGLMAAAMGGGNILYNAEIEYVNPNPPDRLNRPITALEKGLSAAIIPRETPITKSSTSTSIATSSKPYAQASLIPKIPTQTFVDVGTSLFLKERRLYIPFTNTYVSMDLGKPFRTTEAETQYTLDIEWERDRQKQIKNQQLDTIKGFRPDDIITLDGQPTTVKEYKLDIERGGMASQKSLDRQLKEGIESIRYNKKKELIITGVLTGGFGAIAGAGPGLTITGRLAQSARLLGSGAVSQKIVVPTVGTVFEKIKTPTELANIGGVSISDKDIVAQGIGLLSTGALYKASGKISDPLMRLGGRTEFVGTLKGKLPARIGVTSAAKLPKTAIQPLNVGKITKRISESVLTGKTYVSGTITTNQGMVYKSLGYRVPLTAQQTTYFQAAGPMTDKSIKLVTQQISKVTPQTPKLGSKVIETSIGQFKISKGPSNQFIQFRGTDRSMIDAVVSQQRIIQGKVTTLDPALGKPIKGGFQSFTANIDDVSGIITKTYKVGSGRSIGLFGEKPAGIARYSLPDIRDIRISSDVARGGTLSQTSGAYRQVTPRYVKASKPLNINMAATPMDKVLGGFRKVDFPDEVLTQAPKKFTQFSKTGAGGGVRTFQSQVPKIGQYVDDAVYTFSMTSPKQILSQGMASVGGISPYSLVSTAYTPALGRMQASKVSQTQEDRFFAPQKEVEALQVAKRRVDIIPKRDTLNIQETVQFPKTEILKTPKTDLRVDTRNMLGLIQEPTLMPRVDERLEIMQDVDQTVDLKTKLEIITEPKLKITPQPTFFTPPQTSYIPKFKPFAFPLPVPKGSGGRSGGGGWFSVGRWNKKNPLLSAAEAFDLFSNDIFARPKKKKKKVKAKTKKKTKKR